ncbi:hypothetical protein [Hydrogenimonas sp.]
MAYSAEIRARARDYYEVYGWPLSKIGEHLGVPKATLGEWRKKENWMKGALKEEVQEAAKKLKERMESTDIFQEAKKKIAEELEEATGQPRDLIELQTHDLIAENRAEMIIMGALSIEKFDALAFEGVMMAHDKLQHMKKLMRSAPDAVDMKEIKTYNEIVSMAKQQVFGKSPEVVVVNNNATTEDYSRMSDDELRRMLERKQRDTAIENRKEA